MLERHCEAGWLPLVQQPKAIYLTNPVSSDKVFFSVDYISFGCI